MRIGIVGSKEKLTMRSVLTVLGMIAVGFLVWRLLERQGPATPPTDD